MGREEIIFLLQRQCLSIDKSFYVNEALVWQNDVNDICTMAGWYGKSVFAITKVS